MREESEREWRGVKLCEMAIGSTMNVSIRVLRYVGHAVSLTGTHSNIATADTGLPYGPRKVLSGNDDTFDNCNSYEALAATWQTSGYGKQLVITNDTTSADLFEPRDHFELNQVVEIWSRLPYHLHPPD